MKKDHQASWWGLYILAPVAAALLYAGAQMPMGRLGHSLVQVAVAVVISGSALLWTEKHEA